ncbi:deoxyguanosinetriphosphate triphosphohydrolase [Parasporobacterium paucivorans]|uniref:Deoxyguanosinetriphosphate triphosphohydrolase-like protein n=1 Tax=Parasporobacterium paucivorans DSM 15970 TaxID=1122934 RepID=A0A1M6ALB9_9FIRM|nr:deoxyguanosinetriphosphate triphosphohydrolase [Parasporobacterium paucivorans]SHI37255.1 dGTPase [Parasporobacterium paucivorans DSM 15970]
MSIRDKLEENEKIYLSPFASRSRETRGRDRQEEPCDIRTEFQRDRDRILHSKAFRRLKHKTQVFLAPAGDHYRTRLTHTLEVAQIARTIARAISLNEDLTEAIALGHDLGHTPFGHAGEKALNSVCDFKHNEQSIRVVELLERDGAGLNLTWEVKDGILNHKTGCSPSTLEGKVVRLSDKVAYLHHDIDDAIRGRILTDGDIPGEIVRTLGETTKIRLNTLIHDIVYSSLGKNDIHMSPEIYESMLSLRKFMFEHVYTNPLAKGEEPKVTNMLVELFDHYSRHLEELPDEYIYLMEEKGQDQMRVVCDYISGMSDQYSVTKFKELFVPKFWIY